MARPLEDERVKLTRAMEAFWSEMERKLLRKGRDGWSGWDDPSRKQVLEQALLDHSADTARGCPDQAVDTANLAMFLWCMEYMSTKRCSECGGYVEDE
ncbi:MAG: hypothetical protein JRL30_01290 [Deltaproteobacteria bacterium]|nr:hypothetical protein [Deltaproteobacteria bacterium]